VKGVVRREGFGLTSVVELVSYLGLMSFVCLFKLDQRTKLTSLIVYYFFPNTY